MRVEPTVLLGGFNSAWNPFHGTNPPKPPSSKHDTNDARDPSWDKETTTRNQSNSDDALEQHSTSSAAVRHRPYNSSQERVVVLGMVPSPLSSLLLIQLLLLNSLNETTQRVHSANITRMCRSNDAAIRSKGRRPLHNGTQSSRLNCRVFSSRVSQYHYGKVT